VTLLARVATRHADDFECSSGVNREIVETHKRGIVTSASLTWNRPAVSEVADYGREHPSSRGQIPKIGYLVAELKEYPNDSVYL
jgi:predicted glycoside hydrolase/deacetylase ChbG (UPF0249 family)